MSGSRDDAATSLWHGACADLDRPPLCGCPTSSLMAADVDQSLRLAEAQLHQRDQAVAAGEQLAAAVARQLRERVVDRGRALVSNAVGSRLASLDDAPQLFWPQHHVDVRHAEPAHRVDAADTTDGVDPSVPGLADALAPSGFTGVGVYVASSSKRGKSVARGSA
jgi:hypothetical protein